jgi:hypothetical protein
MIAYCSLSFLFSVTFPLTHINGLTLSIIDQSACTVKYNFHNIPIKAGKRQLRLLSLLLLHTHFLIYPWTICSLEKVTRNKIRIILICSFVARSLG